MKDMIQMSKLMDRLLLQQIFECPLCSGQCQSAGPTKIHCLDCGKHWAVRYGVPDFYARYYESTHSTGVSDVYFDDFCEHLLGQLDLPPATYAKAVSDIVRRAGMLVSGDASTTAEIQDLIDRFGFSPRQAPNSLSDQNSVATAAVDQADSMESISILDSTNVAVEFVRHYLPATWAPGIETTVNVRLKNIGTAGWLSSGNDPIFLSYHWHDHASGELLTEGPRTRFPIPVNPQSSLTLPLRVHTPNTIGSYVLRIQLVHEHIRWVEPSLSLAIAISNSKPALHQSISVGGAQSSYAEDHQLGVRMIEDHLSSLPAHRRLVLEVGAGTQPHTAWLPNCDVVALDISAPLLELGSLYFESHSRDNVCFVCADAMQAPFSKARFDSVVIFSALHHFSEPEHLLAYLRGFLKPEGFLAILCEPVGDNIEESDTVRDLLKGINEQVFRLEEYLAIFECARLELISARLDGASFKAILRSINKS